MEIPNQSLSANVSGNSVTSTSLISQSPYTTLEMVVIIIVTGSLSLVTIIGNILVMLSIKVNRNLQTVNNYFLFSLAFADLIIGVCSMNLYTVYIVIGSWPLGAVVCDLWLAVDYVVSNASVMNLLIISFDRYFCVTKPLSYPARRSTKMAGLMIAAAWVLSFILWAPAILFWQFIVGVRTVPSDECYIQFFSNAAVTFGTAIAAFYLPVVIMIGLYWRISKASRSRMRKDSRKTSGTSYGEGPSLSQEEKEENPPNNSGPGESVEEVRDEGTERNMLQQQNGNGPCKKESAEGSTNESSSTPSDQSAPHVPPERSANSGRKQSRGQRAPARGETGCSRKLSCMISPSQRGSNTGSDIPATERQSLVSKTLSKVTKRSPMLKCNRKGMSSREKKVTRTIMAILVAFVVTWTPYNVMVLITTFCSTCIPNSLWTIGYWLCYINSTINPACYALCNTTFKNTFKHLLLCQYKNLRSVR